MANTSKVQASVEVGQHKVADTPSLFKLDPGVGIWALVVFILLLLILKKVVWKPILNTIKERDKSIRDSLNQLEEVRSESQKLAREQEEILSSAKLSASKMISEAKVTAEDVSKAIQTETNQQKEKIVQSGVQEVENIKASAKKELKNYVASLAFELSEKIMEQSLDQKKQKELVDQFLKKIEI